MTILYRVPPGRVFYRICARYSPSRVASGLSSASVPSPYYGVDLYSLIGRGSVYRLSTVFSAWLASSVSD